MRYKCIIFSLTILLVFSGCSNYSENSNSLNEQNITANSVVLYNPRNSDLLYYHIPTKTAGKLNNNHNIVKANSYIQWYPQVDENYHYATYIRDYTKDGLGFHSFYDLPEKKVDSKIDDQFASISKDLRWFFLLDEGTFKIKNRITGDILKIKGPNESILPIDLINDRYLFHATNMAEGSSPAKDIARLDLITEEIKDVEVPKFFSQAIISPDGEHFLVPQYKNITRISYTNDNEYTLLLYDFNNNSWSIIVPTTFDDFGTPLWLNNEIFIYQEITQIHNSENWSGSNRADIEGMSCSKEIYSYSIKTQEQSLLFESNDDCLLLADLSPDLESIFLITRNESVSDFALWQIDIDTGTKKELYFTDHPIDYLSQIYLEPKKLND